MSTNVSVSMQRRIGSITLDNPPDNYLTGHPVPHDMVVSELLAKQRRSSRSC